MMMESQNTSKENESGFRCQKCDKITEECEECEEWACLNWPQEINKTVQILEEKKEVGV